jgi:hypothetical protein
MTASRRFRTFPPSPYNPADRAIGGGLIGARHGGCELVRLLGGGGGAGIDAAVGGGVGAITGVATTPPRPHHLYYRHHVVNRTY